MYSGNSKIDSKVIFVLLAAGLGKRMKMTTPKQFLEYNGEPLFYSSLKTAYENKYIDEIIIVTNHENLDYMLKYCKNKSLLSKVKYIIEGGSERQYSVYNALQKINTGNFVIIQDSARPFLKDKYIENSLKELKENIEYDGVVIGVKCKDTIKIIDENGNIQKTLNRDLLISTHTPQTFRVAVLKEAHEKAIKNKILTTDDASLVEKNFGKIKFLHGDYDNIKITVTEDLKFLETNDIR